MKKIITLGLALALVAVAVPAMAAETITISTVNNATLSNTLSANASSGANLAHGAAAANATVGGNLSNADYDNWAGNEGSIVLGGMGGIIETGTAQSAVVVENRLNITRINIEAEPWAVGAINLGTNNTSNLANILGAGAASGDNEAHGDAATNTTTGGNLDSVGSSNVAGNEAGHVEGGGGGSILTGNTASQVSAVNVMNRNITRIRR